MEEQSKPRGRKPKAESLKKKAHQVYATDEEWDIIEKKAAASGLEVSPFVIKKALS